jgi:aspartate-semialdehyde dehydrogenase
MSQTIDIAVVGASDEVGKTLVELFGERAFPVGNLFLLGDGESAGESLPFRGKNLRVRDVADFDFSQVGLVFFVAGAALTRSYAPRAEAAGCSLIDATGALDAQRAPSAVPEANGLAVEALSLPAQLSSPSPAAVALAVVLAPLRQLVELQRVTLTACLAVSSRGREGVGELARQTAELLNLRPLEPRLFDRQIAFNLLAQVDAGDAAGHGALEKRLAGELRQLLDLPRLAISATCIQAPVFFGDSLSVSMIAEQPFDLALVRQALGTAPGVELLEDDYPTVAGDAVGQDAVYVGRLRGGLDDAHELNLWIASDNVRKGAALNLLQLAGLLIKHYL